MFSWIPIYKEIAKKLLEYKNRQHELIDMIDDMSKKGIKTISLEDEIAKGVRGQLTEIDPFTFFANFNRGTKEENRIKIINEIKTKWHLSSDVPKDFSGIPIVNNMMARFFAWYYERKSSDVALLWQLFEDAMLNSPMFQKTFNDTLKVHCVGPANITMGLFWINPDAYLPLDQNTLRYLKLDFVNLSFDVYKNILDKARLNEKPFYELSYYARENINIENNISNVGYWIFQGNPKYFRVEEYIKDKKVITWTVSQYHK